MNYKQNTLIKTVIFLICILIVPVNTYAFFKDIDENTQNYEVIMDFVSKKIIKGYGDNTFKPNNLINKAEFLKLIFSYYDYKPEAGYYETNFVDVDGESWYAPYVAKALELELIKFNKDWPIFLGASQIERIDAIKMLMSLEGIPAPYFNNEENNFKDISNEYKDLRWVLGAKKSGIYIKDPEQFFYPDKLLSRIEAVDLLHKTTLYKKHIIEEAESYLEVDFNDFFNLTQTEIELLGNEKFEILLSVWSKINQEYIKKDTINKEQLIYGAISGMVNSLNDPNSNFEKPEQAKELFETIGGEYEGIGTLIDIEDEVFKVVGIIKNSPAEKEGLKIGDIVLEIDNKTFNINQLSELINSIKGPAGSKINIKILRDNKTISFDIKREKIHLKTVLLNENTEEIPQEISYIQITQFTDTTKDEFKQIIENIKNSKGIILDLRDNPGGYVDSAIEIVSFFIEKGEVVAKLEIGNDYYDELSTGSGELKNIPTVILVNKWTASASEIVASALKEKNNSILIGEKTYGKGTVQEVTLYIDGSLLKLTIANWLTANGNSIDRVGITPNVIVDSNNEDTQLLWAIKEIKQQITK